jgi:hypothetical protein
MSNSSLSKKNDLMKGSPGRTSSKYDTNSNLFDAGFADPIAKFSFKTRTGYIPNKPSKTN